MDSSRTVIAIVGAGQSAREAELLAAYTQGRAKALLPVAGRPMIAHVVAALAGARHVRHIVVIALDPALGVPWPAPVDYLPDAGSLLDNAEAGFEYACERFPGLDAALWCSADIPLITPAVVDGFIEECFRSDADMYYPVVERAVMEGRFPGSRRSYVHLQDGDFCGGDMLLLRPTLTVRQRETLRSLVGSRKNALQQARAVGLDVLLKLLLHRLSLAEAERRVGRALGVRGRVVPCPWAEIAMDVDKPFQLELVRRELEAGPSLPRPGER